ncbi:N-acetylmuramoyl-L-alanine amidase [Lyngbya sp. CCY1209]|uniref:N-acetylmuramoyl-L-alanine amidase n=1 Tax=Lyngbya sp. CCY1209 TaxID=2886103 RepID=UPI002D20A18B|nr:N-acetylmuramoyl-L-alanine amidase [Lyngbya sp. CCY1209]MEB3886592.1 N-acetylmuramoyl-L-alanine amidase [Lyngbya sp. CCY1209]
MKRILGLAALSWIAIAAPAWAQQPLFLAYPPEGHKTRSDRIFLIGSAAPEGEVLINGEAIDRSPGGHFAPTFPLELGENEFIIRYGDGEIRRTITRLSNQPPVPDGVAFVPESLTPAADIARLPGEILCFGAIAPPGATVSVQLAGQTIPLFAETAIPELPDNKAVLTGNNQPIATPAGRYRGCATISPNSDLAETAIAWGQPEYRLTLGGETVTQTAPGTVSVLSPTQFEVAEVTAEAGVARTGPSTTYSRLTPLPKGTRARITGREGDYLRLDYGGWIKADETRIVTEPAPPNSVIRSAGARRVGEWTEVSFPLQVPVPIEVEQGDRTLTLTLYNTIAQTDTIRFDDSPLIERMDWKPVLSPMGEPREAVQYTFHFKTPQQWGYKVRYEGTTLVLSIKHPPEVGSDAETDGFLAPIRRDKPLNGIRILIDPGHGSENDLGARGPTGYPEKDVNLIVSYLLQAELIQRGATVFMTRKAEEDLWPHDRVEMIEEQEPDLSLSVHYNALPDNGDAIATKGVGMFWYHPQAHSLAVFLHNYLVEKLDRPSYGVFWNNLALTRPSVTPSLLLELGFMINPEEFEWIVDPAEQRKLAAALADGIVEWVEMKTDG